MTNLGWNLHDGAHSGGDHMSPGAVGGIAVVVVVIVMAVVADVVVAAGYYLKVA
jgi:hypothetical protein